VADCGVVGVPDAATGDAVALFVVKRDAALTEAALRDYCVQQLTAYKRPSVIEFREDLPKTAIGKVLRRQLRDELLQHRAAQTQAA
jgi:long-chain acyl-CoA synthetase